MKKKFFFSLITMVMVSMFSFSIVSCGDDDDTYSGGSSSSSGSNSILQTLQNYKWVVTLTDFSTWSDEMSTETQYYTIYFKNNNEGVLHLSTTERDTYFGTSRNEEHFQFSYEISGNKVYLYGDEVDMQLDYYGSYMMWGNDMVEKKTLTTSDYEYLKDDNQGYHGTSGKIDAEMIFDIIHKGTEGPEKGWYYYVIEYSLGVTEDAYKKGVTQMRITMWSENGTLKTESTTYYGKKETYTKHFYSSWLADRFMGIVYSKESHITVNYEVEYYNSKDNEWYTLKSGSVSCYSD